MTAAPSRVPPAPRVQVRAAARLHLGFLDPSASLGRRFGSLGLVIDGHACQLEMSLADRDDLCADDAPGAAELDRAALHIATLRRHSGRLQPLCVRLRRVMPAHAGFGSGTQLALALGRAFAQVHGLDLATTTLAGWLGRGLRSGIGIGGFDAGGLLLDGGPGGDGCPSPVLARVDTPAAWRVIVIEDRRARGLSGADERRAIAALPPLPRALAADICHQVLMRVLPAALTADFGAFALGLNQMQDVLGQHFAAAQGGSAYTSAAVARLATWLRGDGAAPRAAVGQSSWGPTGFAIVSSAAAAESLLALARRDGALDPALTLSTVEVRRRGAEITPLPAADRPVAARTPTPEATDHVD